MKISVAIPVFNEEKTLDALVSKVLKAPLPRGCDIECIIVNDCSTDATENILAGLKDPRIKIFHHDINRGKGAALRTAYEQCTGEVIIVQDADLEYDPAEYPNLLQLIIEGKADVVYGSRFMGGAPHRVVYFWHSLGNKLLTLFSNIYTDLNLTDMETCYKVFKREILEDIELEEDRFGIEPEFTAKVARLAKQKGIAIYEVGISYYGRTYSDGKKIGLKDAFRAIWCIWKYNTSSLAKITKYIAHGGVVATSQFISIIILIELFGFTNSIQQNIANVISIEISVLVGFLLHGFVTWNRKPESPSDLMRRFAKFHLITGVSFAIRVVMFYILSLAAIDYKLNVLAGIAVAVLINYIGYDRYVFKDNLCAQRR